MARARSAADAISVVEGAAEALLWADKRWQKYIESLDSDEAKSPDSDVTRSTRRVDDAKSAAREAQNEIQKLRKGVKALSERLQAASTT